MTHVVFAVARYVCVPDDIRVGLESVPALPFEEDSHQLVQMKCGGDARADEDLCVR